MRSFPTACLLFAIAVAGSPAAASPYPSGYSTSSLIAIDKYFRTELYFGRSIRGGGEVNDEQWKQFLMDEVTPRFPDGFTVLSGYGQYRTKEGVIVSEPSEVLIFLYPAKTKNASRAKIDEIRAAYLKKFDQESVLRVDFNKAIKVAF